MQPDQTSETDNLLQDLLTAITEAGLADKLREAKTAARIVGWIVDETKAPRWLARAIYHWVLVALAARLETAAAGALAKAGKGVAKRIARLPGAVRVLEKLKTVSDRLSTTSDADAELDAFLGTAPVSADLATVADRASVQVLAELRDWREDHAAFRDDVLEMLMAIQDTLDRPLPLRLRLSPNTPQNRFDYRAQAVPLIGREREMAALETFLESPHQVSWWLLTGGGGAGKSRLALELCLAQGGLWQAGFLASDYDDSFDASAWQPLSPTLIVVDYVAARAKPIGNLIRKLIDRESELAFPVRILLLERAKDDIWWNDFRVSSGSFAADMEPHRHAETWQLPALDDVALTQIAQALQAPDPAAVVAALPDLDREARPLFLAFLVDAQKAGEPIGGADRETLVREILAREREKFWPDESEITVEDERLLTFLSIVGEQPTTILTEPPAKGLLPPLNHETLDRHARMVGRQASGRLLPLEPDLLGELYLLDALAKDARAGIGDSHLAVRDLAWTDFGNPLAAFTSGDRCARDYPLHKATPILLTPKVETTLTRAISAMSLFNGIISLGKAGDIDAARHLHDAIRDLAQGHPDEPALRELQAKGTFNLITAYGNAGHIEAARDLHDAIRDLAQDHPDEPALRERQAKGTLNMIVAYCEAGDIDAARVLYDTGKVLAVGHTDEPALREELGQGAVRLVLAYLERDDIETARSMARSEADLLLSDWIETALVARISQETTKTILAAIRNLLE